MDEQKTQRVSVNLSVTEAMYHQQAISYLDGYRDGVNGTIEYLKRQLFILRAQVSQAEPLKTKD